LLLKSKQIRRTLKTLLLLTSLSFFILSAYQVTQYWDYEETLVDLDEIINKTVKKDTLIKEIRRSIDLSEFDDAKMYLEIAKSSDLFKSEINLKKLESELQEKDTSFRQLIKQASNFSSGFLKGKSSNIAGIAGSVAADFTIIGDARDLTSEYVKHQKCEKVDELIILLSGAGFGLTALTIGTRGITAPAKAGTSIIKASVKTQQLTRGFQKSLIKIGRQVFDWPLFTRSLKKNNYNIPNLQRAVKIAYHPDAIKPLRKIAEQINSIRSSTSLADAVHLLKYVDSPHDLSQLKKVSLKYRYKTKGLMKLVGKSALRTVRVLKKTSRLILAILTSFLSGLLSLSLIIMRKSII